MLNVAVRVQTKNTGTEEASKGIPWSRKNEKRLSPGLELKPLTSET